MAIPDYQSIMLPLLKLAGDKQEHKISEVTDTLADQFELSDEEFQSLRSQIGTSSWGGTRYVPMAFTEQGVAMLSSVLKSKQAVEVNIQIMRVFVKMRKWSENYADLLSKIEELESHNDEQDQTIAHIYDLLTQLIKQDESDKPKIGFKTEN